MSRRLLLAAALALLALAGFGPATAAATSCDFEAVVKVTCTNDYQFSGVEITAPAGVVGAFFSVRGGHGEDGPHIGRGGRGAVVEGSLAISPGEMLRATVAASGYGPDPSFGYPAGGFGGAAEAPANGSFGGGNGGGASAVTKIVGYDDLPLLVAGGGGGGGGAGDSYSSSIGGPGGDGAGGNGVGSPQGADGGNPPQQPFPISELGGAGGGGGAEGEDGVDSYPPNSGGGAGGGGGGGYSGPESGGGGGGSPHFTVNGPDRAGAGGGGGGDSYVDPAVQAASFGLAADTCPSGGALNVEFKPAAGCNGEITITWLTESTAVFPFAGGEESAVVNAPFTAPLQVKVISAGTPVAGAPISFSLPSAGPSATFPLAPGSTSVIAETDDLGIATAPQMVANGETGDWTATANIVGLPPVHFALQNEPVPTATLLDAPSRIIAGAPTQFVARVAAGRSGAGIPSGGVSFFVDGARLCPGGASGCEPTPLDGAGNATSPSAALSAGPLGSHQIEAFYVPIGNFGASRASLPSQQVLRGTSLVTVSTDPNPSEAGEAVRLEAVVAAVAPSASEPQGTVRFSVDGEPQAEGLPLAAAKASLEVPLSEGTHEIVATYSGDALLTGGSAAAVQAVGADATAIVLTSSQRPTPFGTPPTFDAKLVAHGASPTGVVAFTVGGEALCEGVATAPLDAVSSTASCTPSALSLLPGRNRVEAAFTPTGPFQPAAATIGQEVIAAATSTAVAAHPSPLVYGAGYGLEAEVEATAVGLGEPSGSVRFSLDGAPLGTPATLNADGGADLAPAGSPAAGAHPIVAAYGGDSIFAAGRGTGFLVVDPEATVTSLTTSAAPTRAGNPVSLLATVEPVGEAAAAAAGTVRFLLDGDPTGDPVPLQGGTATSPPLSGLTVGEHDVQAIFSDPAGNFEGSRGILRQQVVAVNPVTPVPQITPTRCSSKLQLTEVIRVGTDSVRISGLAPFTKTGARVRLESGDRRAGSAEVRADGTFSTRVAISDSARHSDLPYRAQLDRERSPPVSLDRPLASLGRGIGSPTETRFHLRVDGKPGRRLELNRRTGCGESWSKLRDLRSGRAGRVTLRLPRPAPGEGPAIYRLRVKGDGGKGHASLPIVVREAFGG